VIEQEGFQEIDATNFKALNRTFLICLCGHYRLAPTQVLEIVAFRKQFTLVLFLGDTHDRFQIQTFPCFSMYYFI